MSGVGGPLLDSDGNFLGDASGRVSLLVTGFTEGDAVTEAVNVLSEGQGDDSVDVTIELP